MDDSDHHHHDKPDVRQDSIHAYYNDVCAALGGEVMMHPEL